MSRQNFRPTRGNHAFRQFKLVRMAFLLSLALGTQGGALAQGIYVDPDQSTALRLGSASTLNEAAPDTSDETSTYLKAFKMEGAPDEVLILTDDAEVRRGGTTLKGDKITYTFSADEVHAQGNALVARSGAVFKGPELTYHIDAQTGSMPDVKFTYGPKRLRGESDNLEFVGEGKAEFCNAIITTCAEGDKSWWIEADKIDLDQNDEEAVGRHAKLYFAGIPLFYTPYLSLPITDKRRSGFLTPSFGMSSKLGVNAVIPFYWNIAPNYDYTATIHPMSKRGLLLGNEFRYLQPNFGGKLNYDILPDDRETGTNRYAISWNHYWKHSSGLSFGSNYQKVSDDDYVNDFSNNLRESSVTVLPQNFWLSYGKTYWSTSLIVAKNQTLDIEGESYDKPYEKLPEFRLNGYVADYKGFVLSSNFTATKFKNGKIRWRGGYRQKNSGDGSRTMLNSSISYPLKGAAWFITPKVEYSMTWYNMDIDPINKQFVNKHSSRFLPIFSIDSGLVFERESVLFGRNTEQTLEPRLYYVYIPYRNQSRMPVFDSSEADLNFGQLFSPNIYSGWDRIGEANHLSATLTTRFLDGDSGKEWFNATIGQRYYFEDQRVHLGFNNTTPEKMKSDVLLASQFSLIEGLKLEAGARYSTLNERWSKVSIGARYHPKQHSTVGLYYRYNYAPNDPDNDIKQLDFNFQWPITEDLYALGRYNYSFRDKKGIESILGLEYRAGCWTIRGAVQQYTTSSSDKNTSFFIELELLGFGSFGISPIEALKDNIIGYQPLGPKPTEVGRYDYYE